MADDNAVMDSQDRTEAALAAFSGENEGQEDQQGTAGEGQGQGSGQPGGDPDPGQNDPQTVEGQLTDEQRSADPVFKELSEFKDAVGQVFDKHGLVAAAEANGRSAHEEADLQLSDANILYKIMRGEGTPSGLLDTMVNVGNWQKAQKDAVAGDLISWLTKAGYLKDGQASDGKPAAKAGDPGFRDPLEERLAKIETANEKSAREGQERTQQVERDRVGKVFTDHVAKLAKDSGVPEQDVEFYMTQVASMVNGNKAITDRVAKNNFVDIKKFFDTVHSRELQRMDRYNKAVLARQQNKSRNPRNSAGGAPPQPAGQAKRNVANRDDRIAAASEML